MKITKGRLQQIIQEELSRVLKEEYNRDFDEVFMVITALSGGGMEFWPRENKPDFYNSYDDAYAAAKKVNRSNVENKFYRPERATDVVLHLRHDVRVEGGGQAAVRMHARAQPTTQRCERA